MIKTDIMKIRDVYTTRYILSTDIKTHLHNWYMIDSNMSSGPVAPMIVNGWPQKMA